MAEQKISERQAITERIAAFVRDHDLDNPFGGDVGKHGRFYMTMLAIPRVLDGEVRVYGRGFIQVLLRGPLVGGGDSRVFASEQDALAYLRLRLVERDQDGADAVPTK